MEETLDALVVGKWAKAWLQKENLLPSSWGLPIEEAKRIQAANIRITMLFAPASVLELTPNPLAKLESALLVMFDGNSVGAGKLSRDECIAMLLHEIGHHLNKPTPQCKEYPSMSPEWFAGQMEYKAQRMIEHEADDYARHCGFGDAIASGLDKLRRIEPMTFGGKDIESRIQRISGNSPLRLNLLYGS